MTTLFCTACNDDDDPIMLIDFSGIYVGTFNCDGELSDANESKNIAPVKIEDQQASSTDFDQLMNYYDYQLNKNLYLGASVNLITNSIFF